MTDLKLIAIITLNVNRLNNQKPESIRMDIKTNTIQLYDVCLYWTYFRFKDKIDLKVKGWKKIYHTNCNHKKTRVTVLISNKIDF